MVLALFGRLPRRSQDSAEQAAIHDDGHAACGTAAAADEEERVD